MNKQLVLFGRFPYFGQKLLLVGRAGKNGFAALAPSDDMIKSVIIFNPQRPRHERILSMTLRNVNFHF